MRAVLVTKNAPEVGQRKRMTEVAVANQNLHQVWSLNKNVFNLLKAINSKNPKNTPQFSNL